VVAALLLLVFTTGWAAVRMLAAADEDALAP
jgi:hypothetical protein